MKAGFQESAVVDAAEILSVDQNPQAIQLTISHHEHFYENAKTQWQFGDWQSLGRLTLESIQFHPERGRLSLMVAAAHLQLNNVIAAKSFIKCAQEWGCSKKLISQILVSGVHNSLGRAAIMVDQQPDAIRHFETAIAVGTPGSEVRLMSQARANSQKDALEKQSRVQALSGARIKSEARSALGLAKPASRSGRGEARTPGSMASLIVVVGMRHSGSTAMFNIIRLALQHAGVDFVSGYSENPETNLEVMGSDKLRLIKTHEFRDDLAYAGGLVITPRRDLRDSVASAVRRGFNLLNQFKSPVEYAKYNRTLHDVWLPLSDYVFDYEAFIANPVGAIGNLLKFIGLEEVPAARIHAEVLALPTDQYSETLLSPTHITDPERKLSYRDTLSESAIAKINSDHAVWLAHYGYDTSV